MAESDYEYFCGCCADWVGNALGCDRCGFCRVMDPGQSHDEGERFVLRLPEDHKYDPLSLPLGCCTECRAAGKTGDECWDAHFTPRTDRRRAPCPHAPVIVRTA